MMIMGDATSWNVTYGHHSDDSRGVIYDCNIFIKQAIGLFRLVLCEPFPKIAAWQEAPILVTNIEPTDKHSSLFRSSVSDEE